MVDGKFIVPTRKWIQLRNTTEYQSPLLVFVLTDLQERFSVETLDVYQQSVFIPENIVKNSENGKSIKSLLDRFGSLLDIDKGAASLLLKD